MLLVSSGLISFTLDAYVTLIGCVEWLSKAVSPPPPQGFVRARGACDIRDVNQNSENWAIVKAALVAGMYPNLVHVNKDTFLLPSNRERNLLFHPTSVLSQFQLMEVGRKSISQTPPSLLSTHLCSNSY